MIKKLIPLFILTCFAASLFSQREVIDKVIAQVGGEIVLLSELEEQFSLIKERQGDVPADARCMILDNILTTKLLVNQAKLDSIEVTDEEVEAQLNARIEQILEYMGGDLEQFQDYYGQTVTEVKDAFRQDLRAQLLSDRMRAQVMQNVTVTPSEVKRFFNNIPRDSLPYFDSEVEVGEIVMKPQVNEVERQKAIDKLKELRRRIVEDGEDFAELARLFSDDPGSARLGGDLGWTKRGKFVPEFEAAAYKLDDNEISDIVESEFGFHLIQLIARRGNSINTRHILIKPQITDKDLLLTQNKLDSVRNLILADSFTFSQAVKIFGYEDVQSYNNDGKMINPKTGNTYFEIADLEPDVYFTIDTMQVGGISSAYSYLDPRGETLYRIINLQSRTEPHAASLEKDYSKIQEAAIEQKRATYMSDWVAQKVNDTYIRMDAKFEGCPNMQKWIEDRAKP
ncbi:MAG TPA: peptidylprolyl isomerase [Bacteroidetes bacterium]|nr:peptidylprolyl isomerase [Bacteroidota bacterium]